MGDQSATDAAAAQTQDALRPLRNFVSAFQQALGSDQSLAGTDASVANPPGQFYSVGTNGAVSVEGQPVVLSAGGVGVSLPPWMVWLGLGALAYHFLYKRG